MKFSMVLVLASLITSLSAYADVQPNRFQKEYAKMVFDVNVDGGSSTVHQSQVTLPAGANGLVITDFYLYVNSTFQQIGKASVAVQCAGQQDLFAYHDLSTATPNMIFGAHLLQANAYGSGSIIGFGGGSTAVNGGASVLSDCIMSTVIRSDSGFNPVTGGGFTAIVEFFRK